MADKKQVTTSLVILVATVLLVVGLMYVANLNKSQQSNTTQVSQSSRSERNEKPSQSSVPYNDGTYSAVGSYQSPGGQEEIKISITLKNGVVTVTKAESQAHSKDGAQFQSRFIGGYKSKVVGKKIDSIELSQVSGSSLTSEGFNDAIKQIENQAQV